MKLEFRMHYLESAVERYLKAGKKGKGRILDELCKVCGYSRKYAIWKLHEGNFQRKPRKVVRRRDRIYSLRVLSIMGKVWEVAGYPWSVRLREILRLWLPWIKRHYRLTGEEEGRLLAISPSTIDRHLREQKVRIKRRLYGRTKPGTLLRRQIPVRTDFWDVQEAGYAECDLVSHSGQCSSGEFLYSLNLTDIASTWTETRAVMGKGEPGILGKLEEMRQDLPFKLLGIDSDNGSEFINHHLLRYCDRHDLDFTRSRPYKKDDNAHIEQKNWTHVRKLMGWDRYDSIPALHLMNDLYANELRLYMNLFQPSVKLLKTVRKGSRLRRIYDSPQTPLDRLFKLQATSKTIDRDKVEAYQAFRAQLDPFRLAQIVHKKLATIWELAHYRPEVGKKKTDSLKGLSQTEQQALKEISKVFGIKVMVRPRKGADLVVINHG